MSQKRDSNNIIPSKKKRLKLGNKTSDNSDEHNTSKKRTIKEINDNVEDRHLRMSNEVPIYNSGERGQLVQEKHKSKKKNRKKRHSRSGNDLKKPKLKYKSD